MRRCPRGRPSSVRPWIDGQPTYYTVNHFCANFLVNVKHPALKAVEQHNKKSKQTILQS